MNKISIGGLKAARKIYNAVYPDKNRFGRNWKLFSNKEYANKIIYESLASSEPCMIARFGSTEMLALTNYWGVYRSDKSGRVKSFVRSDIPPWWWERSTVLQMQNWSGFFPADVKHLERFCELVIKDIPQVDILGSWLKQEDFFKDELIKAKRVVLEDLEPFFASAPWTKALEHKKVLVVHPFVQTIEHQYEKRQLLFKDNLLPAFELKTIKAVQSLAGNKTQFGTWFDALDHMKGEIDRTDYDVCILGCGAYGFPLAAHVKRQGKKAIHLAGVTQLLFGIIGRRWENYIVWPYMNLFNEHWVRPGDEEKPRNARMVEDACYW